jgi:Coenzyme PQQ synthesis protein D (PqqD)
MAGGGAPAGQGGTYTKDPDFVFRRIADEIVLLPIRRNMGDLESIYTLNGVGARVWELLDGRRTSRDVSATIVEEYEVTAEQAGIDVADFLAQLEAIGAVRRQGS